MDDAFEAEIDNTIEKKFRDLKLEIQVISYALRKDYNIVFSFTKEYFTIEPFKVIFEIIKKNRMTFSKDIIYKFIKNVVDENRRDIYKTYIIKIYDEDISQVNRHSVEVLISKLKELQEARNIINGVRKVITDIDKFSVEKAKRILHRSIYSDYSKNTRYSGDFLEDFEERKQLIVDRKENPKMLVGVPTGIKEFDELSGGIMRGEFGVVIAATGMGKSVALGNFATNAWLRGYNVLIVSLEMTKHQIQFRIDSRISKIMHTKFRKATLDEKDLKIWDIKVKRLREKRKNFLEVLCLSRGCCALEIEEESMKLQSRKNAQIDLIIVDYLNLMSSNESGRDKRDWKQQGEIAWDLKNLSMEFNGIGIPIWTANQITDEGSSAKKLETKHLKYSRVISEVSPVIVALHQSIDDSLQDIMKLWILKCRDFEKIKRPIILHPKFNIMMLNQETINIAKNEFMNK